MWVGNIKPRSLMLDSSFSSPSLPPSTFRVLTDQGDKSGVMILSPVFPWKTSLDDEEREREFREEMQLSCRF